MGGLRKYMPITYFTALIGTLALIGFPGFSGFFSKDALIEAVHLAAEEHGSAIHWYAYWSVLLGVFVTSLYSFRLLFLVFHGAERMDHHTRSHLHESPAVVWVPLVLLAIPSVVIGWLTIGPVLFGEFFGGAIVVLPDQNALHELGAEFEGSGHFVLHALAAPTALLLAAAGAVVAWFLYLKRPDLPAVIQGHMGAVYRILVNKYYFDWFNEQVLARFARLTGAGLSRVGDQMIIDGALVNGSARAVGWLAGVMRWLQSGYLYHYAFAMIFGLAALASWIVFRS
jgi:NADH-quinone oxidoreductase subunit L